MERLKRKEHPYINKLDSYLKRVENKLIDYSCGLHTDVEYDDIEQVLRISSRIDTIKDSISNTRNYLDPDYIPRQLLMGINNGKR